MPPPEVLPMAMAALIAVGEPVPLLKLTVPLPAVIPVPETLEPQEFVTILAEIPVALDDTPMQFDTEIASIP